MLSMLGMAALPIAKGIGNLIANKGKKSTANPGLAGIGTAGLNAIAGPHNAMLDNAAQSSGNPFQDSQFQGQGHEYSKDVTQSMSKEGSFTNQAIGTLGSLAGVGGELLGSFMTGERERIEDPFIAKMQAERHKQANMGIQTGNNMAASAQNAAQVASRDVADQATRSGLSAGMGVDNSLVAAASGMAKDTQMAGNYSQAAAQGGQMATQGQSFKGDGTRDALDRVIYDVGINQDYAMPSAIASAASAVPQAMFDGKAYRGDMNMVDLQSYDVYSDESTNALRHWHGNSLRERNDYMKQGHRPHEIFYGRQFRR